MKQKIAMITLAIIGCLSLVGAPYRAYAAGLQCAVLPQEICKSAGASSDGGVVNTGAGKLLIQVLNVLTALVGVVAVGMFVWAGIMYASADGNSNRVSQAKTIMTNTTIGIVAFGLMYLALNWLIPGGILSS